MVMSEYADWDTGGDVRPGLERIAATVGVSVKTTKRCVTQLVTAEWLAIDARGSFGRATVYRLTVPALVNLSDGTVTPPVTGSLVSPLDGTPDTRNGVTGVHVTGSPMTPHLCQTFPRLLWVAA